MVLLSAQGMDAPAIATVAFTSEDRGRDAIRNFNSDGFGSFIPSKKAAACRSSPSRSAESAWSRSLTAVRHTGRWGYMRRRWLT